MGNIGHWVATMGFAVELQKGGLEGAKLPPDLTPAMVFIIDNETFPSQKCTKLIERGSANAGEYNDKLTELPEMTKLKLMWECIKLFFYDPNVRWRAFYHQFWDQFLNVTYLLQMYMRVYTVDFILKSTYSQSDLFHVK